MILAWFPDTDMKHQFENPLKANGKWTPLIGETTYKIIMANKDELDSAIQNSRDFDYNYFGFKTLERSYLMKIDGKIAERPQHMLMRVSVGIHGEDIKSAIKVCKNNLEKCSFLWVLCSDLYKHGKQVLHSCISNFVQCRNSTPSIVFMFSSDHEGRFNRGYL